MTWRRYRDGDDIEPPNDVLLGVDGEYNGYGTGPGEGVATPRALANWANLCGATGVRGFPPLLRIARERGTGFGDRMGGGVVAAVESVGCCDETDLTL